MKSYTEYLTSMNNHEAIWDAIEAERESWHAARDEEERRDIVRSIRTLEDLRDHLEAAMEAYEDDEILAAAMGTVKAALERKREVRA